MKQLGSLSILILLVFTVYGCNYSTKSSATGGVVSPAPSQLDLERVVTFRVFGKGVEPEAALTKGQARLMAEKAAIADGYRQFAEKLSGVYVDAYMSSGYGKVDEDWLKTSVRTMLRGVDIKEITHDEYGIARAAMELRVNFTKYGMVWWPEGLGKDVTPLATGRGGSMEVASRDQQIR
ncbi:MAG: hypothetical protein MI802_03170 [Desulfobacterales bacterium]|nr:hypothetical protein [Desulfobacterales bacterium]